MSHIPTTLAAAGAVVLALAILLLILALHRSATARIWAALTHDDPTAEHARRNTLAALTERRPPRPRR